MPLFRLLSRLSCREIKIFNLAPTEQDRIFNIVGIAHILDVIYSTRPDSTDSYQIVDDLMNADLKYVPESQPIHSLLQDLKASPNMMAFVVNEYGGIVGFVTVEDLVEEIVGEFTDERDSNHQIRKIDEDVIECDGRTTIDNLNDSFDLGIPTGDYETISGYILDRVKRLPAVGTQIDTESIIITVTEANDRAIKQIRIRKNHV